MLGRLRLKQRSRPARWRRFWRGLADFALRAAGDADDPGGAQGGERGGAGPANVEAVNPAVFAAQLKEVLKSQGEATAGAVHVIDLAKLKNRFGEEWPRVQRRVDIVARNVIEHRLTAADMYVAQDGPVYLIMFATLTVDVARAKCALMASEIEHRLLGDEETKDSGVNVQAAVARLGPKLSVDRIDVKSVIAEVMARGKDAGPARSAVGALPDASSAAALSAAEEEASKRAALLEAAGQDVEDEADRDPGWQEQESRYAEAYFPDIEFAYAPMWDTQNQAVSVFLCLPMSSDPVYGGRKTMSFTRPMQALKLDLLALRKVLRDLKAGFDQGRPFILSFPLHFMTLGDAKMRTQFLKVASRIPPEYAKRLSCEIINVPDGVPSIQLYDAVASIKPHVRWVTMRLRPEETAFGRYTGLRITSVGLDLSQARGSEADLLKKLEAFAEAGAHHGLRTYVHGARSRSLTVGVLCAGFNYISGPLVGDALSAPNAMYRFRTQDIYSALIAEPPAAGEPAPAAPEDANL